MKTQTKSRTHEHHFVTLPSGIRKCECGKWLNAEGAEPIVGIPAKEEVAGVSAHEAGNVGVKTKSPLFQSWVDGIAGAWELAGKDSAAQVYNEILAAFELKRWEALALGEQVRIKLKEKGVL